MPREETEASVSFEKMVNEFENLKRGNGTTIISAAMGYNLAGEGKIEIEGKEVEIQNGVFTYCLKDGLFNYKADLNGDKHVSISELKQYLILNVPKLNKGQIPMTRQENLINDWLLN
ncbi:MAG: hypothetical protein IPJ79_01270 [Bacteroidetes bacterium]|nr:hypothetical protein [Bacteroidota bacterium]